MGKFRLGWLFEDGTVQVKTFAQKAHKLLPRLSAMVPAKNLKGICVVAGPGSFSSVRSGVLDANLLARLWRLPLIGVRVEETEELPSLAKRLASFRTRSAEYVAPLYDAEPNITVRVC